MLVTSLSWKCPEHKVPGKLLIKKKNGKGVLHNVVHKIPNDIFVPFIKHTWGCLWNLTNGLSWKSAFIMALCKVYFIMDQ
jgi:hypothetical protein